MRRLRKYDTRGHDCERDSKIHASRRPSNLQCIVIIVVVIGVIITGRSYSSGLDTRKRALDTVGGRDAVTRLSSKQPSAETTDRQRCIPSPLETRASSSVYGCAEITEMLAGHKVYLGSGYWRDVYRVEYQGKTIAVKRLKKTQQETERNRRRHQWEAAALEAVSDNPNIVHLLGKCNSILVTEYLSSYLDLVLMGDHKRSKTKAIQLEPLSTRRILTMALDAARGLQALHEAEFGPIVHADLQPRQLLIDPNGVVKINDLNRCRFMGRDDYGNPCPFKISKAGGIWRSPEEYRGDALTEKIDIYSMGMIFWSMYSRQPPLDRKSDYKNRVMSGERPWVDDAWYHGFVQLFQQMWDDDPLKRPAAGQIVYRLKTMLQELFAEE